MSVEIGGEQRHYGGRVLVLEAPSEVSFESRWAPRHDWPVPTFCTLRLTSVYDATLVEILHHGCERMGAAAADDLQDDESGWDVKHLKALRAIVES